VSKTAQGQIKTITKKQKKKRNLLQGQNCHYLASNDNNKCLDVCLSDVGSA